jgi:hypothetical protein
MDQTARFETVVPAEQKPGKPGVAKAKGKSSDHQHDETHHQKRVLPHLIGPHPAHLGFFLRDKNALLYEIYNPVKSHQADDDENRYDVDNPDTLRHWILFLNGNESMNGRSRQFNRYARMAFPAGAL